MGHLNVFVYVLFIATVVDCKIPDYIKVCPQNDPQIESCILESIENLRPRLRSGIPELSVPSLEPLVINVLSLKRGPNSANVDLNITRLQIWGPGSFVITSVRHDIPKSRFNFQILLPKLNFKGLYSINMNILLIEFKGQGPIVGNLTDMTADVKMQGRIIRNKANGENYLRFNPLQIRTKISRASLRLYGLFGKSPSLNQLANDVIEQNSKQFIEEIRPALESSMSQVFTNVANKITGRFTYNELFPK